MCLCIFAGPENDETCESYERITSLSGPENWRYQNSIFFHVLSFSVYSFSFRYFPFMCFPFVHFPFVFFPFLYFLFLSCSFPFLFFPLLSFAFLFISKATWVEARSFDLSIYGLVSPVLPWKSMHWRVQLYLWKSASWRAQLFFLNHGLEGPIFISKIFGLKSPELTLTISGLVSPAISWKSIGWMVQLYFKNMRAGEPRFFFENLWTGGHNLIFKTLWIEEHCFDLFKKLWTCEPRNILSIYGLKGPALFKKNPRAGEPSFCLKIDWLEGKILFRNLQGKRPRFDFNHLRTGEPSYSISWKSMHWRVHLYIEKSAS